VIIVFALVAEYRKKSLNGWKRNLKRSELMFIWENIFILWALVIGFTIGVKFQQALINKEIRKGNLEIIRKG
jgi:hypothetical protein